MFDLLCNSNLLMSVPSWIHFLFLFHCGLMVSIPVLWSDQFSVSDPVSWNITATNCEQNLFGIGTLAYIYICRRYSACNVAAFRHVSNDTLSCKGAHRMCL